MTTDPRTEYEFSLPLGYHDAYGRRHQRGVMRLATALDEIEPLGDPRVRHNEAFFGLLLLSRVVRRLGDFSPVPPEVIAGLYASDFAFLQSLYVELNAAPHTAGTHFPPPPSSAPSGEVETSCPQCGAELVLDLGAAAKGAEEVGA